MSFTCYEFKNNIYWQPEIKSEKNQHPLHLTFTCNCICWDFFLISYIIYILSWLMAFICFSVTIISTGFTIVVHLNASFQFALNLLDTPSLDWWEFNLCLFVCFLHEHTFPELVYIWTYLFVSFKIYGQFWLHSWDTFSFLEDFL